MSYYPKSKILENQYTSGTEYQRIDTNQPYVGSYCILSDGRYFTGKTLLENSIELKKIELTQKNAFPSMFLSGNLFNKIPFLNSLSKQQELRPTILTISNHEYQRGFVTRYFAKKLNVDGIQIFEITQQDHNDIINKTGKYHPIYQSISMDWKITGPDRDNFDNSLNPTYGIIDTNKRTLEIKEKEMSGIKKYFEGRLKEYAK